MNAQAATARSRSLRRVALGVTVPALIACSSSDADDATPLAPAAPAQPAPTASYLTIAPSKARIDRGDVLRLAVVAQDAQRRVMPRAAVTWTSADTTIAAVDQGGVVHARSAGYVAIVAMSGAATAHTLLQVAVAGEYPHGVVLQPDNVTLAACDSAVFHAATDPDVGDTRFAWSTSDAAVLDIGAHSAVRATGVVRGNAPGTATLEVIWLPDPSRRITRAFTVTPCAH